jgi:uncharacterized membrane protein
MAFVPKQPRPLKVARGCSPTASLIADASDEWLLYSVLTTAAAAGHRLGTSSKLGRIVTGPICTMALTFAAAGAQVLPVAGVGVSAAQGLAVRLATPLLLFGADLRAIARRAGKLLPAFLLGSVGTVLGTLAGLSLLRAPLTAAFGAEGVKVVAALMAKNIGGGINFVAVAGTLGLSPGPFAAALAADNLMALIYFPVCSFLGRSEVDPYAEAMGASSETTEPQEAEAADPASIGNLGSALAIGVACVTLSRQLSPGGGYDLPIATALTVAAATAAPRLLRPLASAAERLGTLALYLFFATAGWVGGDLGASGFLGGGVVLLGFLLILYAVHLTVVLGLGSLLRNPLQQDATPLPLSVRLTASNANIGGPATACALAVGCGWAGLVTPALLVGNLGYAVATPLGLLLHTLW